MTLMPESDDASTDAIYLYLKRRAEHDLQIDASAQFPSFSEWEIVTTDVKAAYPGSEKPGKATRLASELWQRWKLPTLFFMLSHEIIEERLTAMEAHGESDNWSHWRDHADLCQRYRLAAKGYFGAAECDC